MNLSTRITVLLLILALLPGCSLFSKKEQDPDEPMPLVKIDDPVRMKTVWSSKVGNGQGKQYNRLMPVVSGNRLYAASNDGVVVALDRTTGKREWRRKLRRVEITGGTGIGEGLVLLGTENSTVIALDAETGEDVWTSEVSSEVLSPPVAGRGVVVVQTVDGKLQALDANTGETRWLYESTVPALTLRGTSSPIISQNYVIAGFGNGSVVSVALDNGTLRWEQRIAIPTGRSDIDRIVDIDGSLFIADNGLLVVPSQKDNLVGLDVNTGQLRWGVEAPSINGVAAGFGNTYVAETSGKLAALRMNQQEPVWENEQMLNRVLTAPATLNNYVLVGDSEGYVHMLSQVNGNMVGRFKVGGDGLRVPMLTRDDTLYVMANSGKLKAYQLR